ncbi:MAG: PP2C family protein-serine/threonine phosphatase [Acidobacteriia bacterium]|nr:PP2C family protein-serine/threonine phosphatase [Terriglobia bacterium]
MPDASSRDPTERAHQAANFFSRVGATLDAFWQRVTEGIEIQVLWTQFVAEARASYSLYAREVDWDALAHESRGRRILKTASALFWAMLMKLSPARRVFLLIALVLGLLALVQGNQVRTDHRTFTQPPQNFTFILLSLAALIFLLALELADRVTMKRDLEIAREIQRWLVPESPPQVAGADIAFATRPANTVGGDYYDAFLREVQGGAATANRLLLVVADVAGKSVPAALLMATFQASLRALSNAHQPLAELVTGMNRYACAHSLGGRRFTTAFFAELDAAARVLTYIGAGHNAPVLRRASGTLERLNSRSLPLGIDPRAQFTTATLTLAAGDLLVCYTDGVIDAVNAQDEDYGEARLLELVKAGGGESAASTLKRLMADVEKFVGATRQHDDITGLVLRAV